MSNSSTKKFAFVLGRERELCLAELKAVLKRFCFGFDPFDRAGKPALLRAGILSVADNIVYINIDLSPDNVKKLSSTLGGTVKIYQIVGEAPDLKSAMAAYIEGSFKDRGKVAFGLSVYQPERLNLTHRMVNNIGFQVKKELKGLSVSSRFIELKEGTEVPTILSLKENLIGKGVEFGLFPGGFGVLAGLSNPEEWSKRDYDKPAGDKYSGMLPPKLARIMINLALGQDCQQSVVSSQQNPTNCKRPTTNCLVVDPFCGSGNILMEALMLGCDAFGSDISEKAVSDSHANLDWLAAKYQLINANYSLTQADAAAANLSDLLITNYRLSATNIPQLVIVTEPFLGEPKKFKPTLNAVRGEYGKIKEIYLRFLKNFAKADLPSGTVFCVVFPLVETLEEKRFSLFRECVDEIGKIGYTKIQSPLIYGRDYQVVKREIALLKFLSPNS